jgi:hypothetical protein
MAAALLYAQHVLLSLATETFSLLHPHGRSSVKFPYESTLDSSCELTLRGKQPQIPPQTPFNTTRLPRIPRFGPAGKSAKTMKVSRATPLRRTMDGHERLRCNCLYLALGRGSLPIACDIPWEDLFANMADRSAGLLCSNDYAERMNSELGRWERSQRQFDANFAHHYPEVAAAVFVLFWENTRD